MTVRAMAIESGWCAPDIDLGSQHISYDWGSFPKAHGLKGSMSRRGNCHDSAVAESIFQLLKRERVKRKTYNRVARSVQISSITSNCSITIGAGIVLMN